MGKKQHSKDRLYLTTTEWRTEWGGFKDKLALPFKRLPFHCCGITFTPFEDPVCTDDGTVFDIVNIVPYLQKYHRCGLERLSGAAVATPLPALTPLTAPSPGAVSAGPWRRRHPVSGQPLLLKDLTKLTFHKNADGEYHCPVMNKVRGAQHQLPRRRRSCCGPVSPRRLPHSFFL